MTTVIALMGLPGSGKTTFMELLREQMTLSLISRDLIRTLRTFWYSRLPNTFLCVPYCDDREDKEQVLYGDDKHNNCFRVRSFFVLRRSRIQGLYATLCLWHMRNHNLSNNSYQTGLSEKEARCYVALLKVGQGTAYKVALVAGLKKPITYAVLETSDRIKTCFTSAVSSSRQKIRVESTRARYRFV